MAITTQYGTATLSATLGAGGVTPSITVTATVTHTTSNVFTHQIISGVSDLNGPIVISATRLTDTTVTVSADRQIPAGEKIVFRWCSIDGSA